METYIVLLVFVFTVLIFIALDSFKYSENRVLLLAVIAACTFLLFYVLIDPRFQVSGISGVLETSTEGFEDGTTMDDSDLSQYGNISLSTDIDQTEQRILGMGEEIPDNEMTSGSIDNSDVVQAVMLRGSSYFQPNWKGISPVSNGENTSFSLAEPAEEGKRSPYDMTLSGAQDADEMMSRKQQQRQHLAKQSLDGHIRATRNIYQKYFTAELKDEEDKEWWGTEARDYETNFRAWT